MGMTFGHAAAAAGISEGTFYRWKSIGEKAKSGKYHEFYEALKSAEARGEMLLLKRIQEASAGGTWQAGAWILERRYRNIWGRNIDLTSEGKAIRTIDFTALTIEQLRRIANGEDIDAVVSD